jgi:hypothetical protein
MIGRKIIEGGLVLLLGISSLDLPRDIYAGTIETTTQAVKKESEEKSNYKLVERGFRKFLDNYIDNESGTTWFKDSINKFGHDKFHEQYGNAHLECLKFAEIKVKEFKSGKIKSLDIGDKEYKILGDKMCEIINSVSAGWVDYNNPKVREKERGFVRALTGYFTRVMLVEDKCISYDELVRKAYGTRKEYEKYIIEQNNANDSAFEELRLTVGKFFRWMGGDTEMTKLKKDAADAYKSTIKEIFGEENIKN